MFKPVVILWEIAQPFGLRCRAENQYRSSDASFVGAALCCEEAGTANRQALSARPLRSTRLLLQNLAEPMSHVLFYERGRAREGLQSSPSQGFRR